MHRILDLHLLIGICLICVGMWAHARPHALLDVVLTPQEIRNEDKAAATLSLLKQGAGSDSAWLFWAGALLTATSITAKFASARVRHTNAPDFAPQKK